MGRSYLPEEWARNSNASMPVKALACVLSSYANGDCGNQDVWPSPETVAGHLGVTARHVQNLSAEGESLAWWTRIHERNRNGGVMLTWRLHFPEFSTNRTPTELERNYSSLGENHCSLPNGSPTEAQQNPNGSRTEAERNHSSDGRYKGTKVEMIKGTTIPPTPAGQGMLLAVEEEPKHNNARLLIDAYNELCPSLPKCHGKTGSSALQKAAAAWKREPDMDLWRSRFAIAEASDFLTGRAGRTGSHANWRCDFLWIIKRENSEKIDSGKYSHDQQDRDLAIKAEQVRKWWNETLVAQHDHAFVPKVDPKFIAVFANAHDAVCRDSNHDNANPPLLGLMQWACEYSAFWGKGERKVRHPDDKPERAPWKPEVWLSSSNLAAIVAAYQQDCIDNNEEPHLYLKGDPRYA